MATPESLVFRGMEGTGAAQIFGQPGNPMKAFSERQQRIDKQRAVQAELERREKERRDKQTWDILQTDPDKAWEPFDNQVSEAANAVHEKHAAMLAARPSLANDPRFLAQVKADWEPVNNLARKSQYVKSEIQSSRDATTKNPYLQEEYYHPKFNDLYLNPDGTAKNLDEIDINAIRNLHINDPGGFNFQKYEKDYKDGLNENMQDFVDTKAMNNGELTTETQTKWRGGIYTRDPNSDIGVAVDANGQPIINMSPTLKNSFLNSDFARRAYEARAQQLGVPVDDLVKNAFQNVGGLQVNKTPHRYREPFIPQWLYNQQNPGMSKTDQDFSSSVFDDIKNMTNAFYDDDGSRRSVASDKARASAGQLRGQKYGNGRIEEAEFVPGTNKQGKSQMLGGMLNNSPNDRIILKISSGTAGRTRLEDIDLTDEGVAPEFWNIFQQGGRFGKRSIDFDEAAEKLGVNPRELYRGREYMGANLEAEQQQLNQLSQGQGFEELMGRFLDGQEIKSITPETTRTLRHPIDGEFASYKIKTADGKEHTILRDDIDALQQLLRSKKKVEPAGKKKTGIDWEN